MPRSSAALWRLAAAAHGVRAATGAANQALYGKMPSVVYQDFPEARLIILWGVNPSASGIHPVPTCATRRSAARACGRGSAHHAAGEAGRPASGGAPGHDLPVALSIHRYLFENGPRRSDRSSPRTRNAHRLRERASKWTFDCAAAEAGVAAADIERLAEWYATTSPAVVKCGWGQERNRNGGSSSMAIMALAAVAGKFGVRGGGYAMSNSNAWGIERTWIRAQEPDTRLVNMNQLGRALTEYTDPPVKALFVYNSNAAVTSPHQTKVLQGLEREDLFTVVFDCTLTDTARYADVLCPARRSSKATTWCAPTAPSACSLEDRLWNGGRIAPETRMSSASCCSGSSSTPRATQAESSKK
jgi:anaerobic selenocysteine-containing dehydrogenase